MYTVLLISLNCSPAIAADPWSKQDIALEATWQVLNLIDYGQTRWMANHDWTWDGKKYHEHNFILGSHPSVKKTDAYFAIGSLAHIAITHFAGKYRIYWQGATIAASGFCIIGNDRLGAGLNFEF